MSDSAQLLASRCNPKAFSLKRMARTLENKTVLRSEPLLFYSPPIYRQSRQTWPAPADFAKAVTSGGGPRVLRSWRGRSRPRALAGQIDSPAFRRRHARARNPAVPV